MGTTHGITSTSTKSSHSLKTSFTPSKQFLSRKWIIVSFGNTQSFRYLSRLGIKDVTTTYPLAALVGMDGTLYWRQSDVVRCIGRDPFSTENCLYGKDVLESRKASAYERSCRILTTEQVQEAFTTHHKKLACMFRKVYLNGPCSVKYQKAIEFGITPGLQTVLHLHVAETTIGVALEKFVSHVLQQKVVAKRPKRVRHSKSHLPRQRIYLSRKCKDWVGRDDGRVKNIFESPILPPREEVKEEKKVTLSPQQVQAQEEHATEEMMDDEMPSQEQSSKDWLDEIQKWAQEMLDGEMPILSQNQVDEELVTEEMPTTLQQEQSYKELGNEEMPSSSRENKSV